MESEEIQTCREEKKGEREQKIVCNEVKPEVGIIGADVE